jgi:hypothetical protein
MNVADHARYGTQSINNIIAHVDTDSVLRKAALEKLRGQIDAGIEQIDAEQKAAAEALLSGE